MTKIIVFISLTLLISWNIKTTTYNESTASNVNDSNKVVDIGLFEKYELLPKLNFQKTTKEEFYTIKNKCEFVPFLPKYDKDSFFINCKNAQYKFKQYKYYKENNGWCGYEPLAYYPHLKLYAITDNVNSDNLVFGELFLLDSISGYRYNIISIGDGCVELPSISPNNKYLVYFYNHIYDQNICDIGLFKINNKLNPKEYLIEYRSYHSEEFKIKKLIWKSDSCIYIEGFEEVFENDKWSEKYKYYKTEIK